MTIWSTFGFLTQFLALVVGGSGCAPRVVSYHPCVDHAAAPDAHQFWSAVDLSETDGVPGAPIVVVEENDLEDEAALPSTPDFLIASQLSTPTVAERFKTASLPDVDPRPARSPPAV
jgi:hypothetical protein